MPLTPQQIVHYYYSRGGGTKKFLRIISPLQRTEIKNGDIVDIEAVGNVSSAVFEYQDLSGVWKNIGNAIKEDDTFTFSSWSPPEAFVAIRAKSGSTEGQVNIWPVIVEDSFTDDNGTLLQDHSPQSQWMPWLVESVDWHINNNTLTITNDDSSLYFAVVDTGTEDAHIRCKFKTTATHSVTFRYTDSNNHIYILYEISNQRVRIFERKNGVNTNLLDFTALPYDGNTVYEFYCIADKVFIKPESGDFLAAVTSILTGTKHGVRRPGVNATYAWDDVSIFAIGRQPVNPVVSYVATKSNIHVIEKGQFPGLDDNAVDAPCLRLVNGIVYCLFSCRNSDNEFHGITFATANPDDPHNWVRHDGLILEQNNDEWDAEIADCTAYWDGSQWYIVYSGRTTGIIGYATGPDLFNLTKQGQILDRTGQGEYLRQPDLLVKDGVWYLYCNRRYDQPSGEYGNVVCFYGPDLNNLSGPVEVLSNPGYSFDGQDLTAPSIRFNASKKLFELLYSGYSVRGGAPYIHEVGLAVANDPLGPFVRVSTQPLIPIGGPIDQLHCHAPEWYPEKNIIYYVANNSSGGSYDGISYATIE
jgi:hypothetical protein